MAEQALTRSLEQYSAAALSAVRRLPLAFWRNIVVVVALVWICHSLARLIWAMFPAPALPLPPVIAIQNAGDAGGAPAYVVDLATLQKQQIFGEGLAATPEIDVVEAAPGIEDNAARTQLKLKLVGLLASNVSEESTAIIASGSDQAIYQIDDKLPVGNSVVLAKILSDRVILNNSGNYESLWLYSEADFKVTYGYTSDAATGSGRPTPRRPAAPATVETKLKPSELPKSISDVVRFSVHRENGEMQGFRIRPGKNKELFERLGLQTNDIVTSVNGIPIDTAQAIRDNYQQLKNATNADLEIRRGEEIIYVNVSLDTSSE